MAHLVITGIQVSCGGSQLVADTQITNLCYINKAPQLFADGEAGVFYFTTDGKLMMISDAGGSRRFLFVSMVEPKPQCDSR
jgi:hypothetical protein